MTPPRDPMAALEPLVDLVVDRVLQRIRAEVPTKSVTPDWMTLDEARLHLRVSDSTIRRWKRCGKLPTRRAGRRILARSTDVEALARPVEIESSVEAGGLESASDPEVERIWSRITRRAS